MKLSTSFLSIKNNIKENLQKLDNSTTDYIHCDIMDGNFVENKTRGFNEMFGLLKDIKKSLDVHLMVEDIELYVSEYSKLKPEIITIHYEVLKDLPNQDNIIKHIKNQGIKFGISLKPNTDIEVLNRYVPDIDLVLLMSVEPGYGGQKFLMNTIKKIENLNKLKEEYNLKFLIEVDGGINAETIKYCTGADIVVIGSYITNEEDYQKQIDLLKLRNQLD